MADPMQTVISGKGVRGDGHGNRTEHDNMLRLQGGQRTEVGLKHSVVAAGPKLWGAVSEGRQRRAIVDERPFANVVHERMGFRENIRVIPGHDFKGSERRLSALRLDQMFEALLIAAQLLSVRLGSAGIRVSTIRGQCGGRPAQQHNDDRDFPKQGFHDEIRQCP